MENKLIALGIIISIIVIILGFLFNINNQAYNKESSYKSIQENNERNYGMMRSNTGHMMYNSHYNMMRGYDIK